MHKFKDKIKSTGKKIYNSIPVSVRSIPFNTVKREIKRAKKYNRTQSNSGLFVSNVNRMTDF